MTLSKIMWIICAIIWAVVILGFFALVIVNRIKNRRSRDDQNE